MAPDVTDDLALLQSVVEFGVGDFDGDAVDGTTVDLDAQCFAVAAEPNLGAVGDVVREGPHRPTAHMTPTVTSMIVSKVASMTTVGIQRFIRLTLSARSFVHGAIVRTCPLASICLRNCPDSGL